MLSLFVTEILIRIDQIQAPVFVQCLYHLIEGIGLQEIIMVREHQKLAGGHTDGSIGILWKYPHSPPGVSGECVDQNRLFSHTKA